MTFTSICWRKTDSGNYQAVRYKRLRNTQRSYLETLGKDYDSAAYFELRLQIGLRHALIELPLSLYQCSYLYLQGLILKKLNLLII
ncbi:MAG: protoglobin domain-containing protein [Gammaproteobacteria bacterium]